MSERRLRTSKRKQRQRARFWNDHGEKIRVALIGGVMVVVGYMLAKAALG